MALDSITVHRTGTAASWDGITTVSIWTDPNGDGKTADGTKLGEAAVSGNATVVTFPEAQKIVVGFPQKWLLCYTFNSNAAGAGTYGAQVAGPGDFAIDVIQGGNDFVEAVTVSSNLIDISPFQFPSLTGATVNPLVFETWNSVTGPYLPGGMYTPSISAPVTTTVAGSDVSFWTASLAQAASATTGPYGCGFGTLDATHALSRISGSWVNAGYFRTSHLFGSGVNFDLTDVKGVDALTLQCKAHFNSTPAPQVPALEPNVKLLLRTTGAQYLQVSLRPGDGDKAIGLLSNGASALETNCAGDLDSLGGPATYDVTAKFAKLDATHTWVSYELRNVSTGASTSDTRILDNLISLDINEIRIDFDKDANALIDDIDLKTLRVTSNGDVLQFNGTDGTGLNAYKIPGPTLTILKLDGGVTSGSEVGLAGVNVSITGSGVGDADIKRVYLYEDLDKNGLVTAGDTLFGSGTLSGASAHVGLTAPEIFLVGSRNLLLAAQFANSAAGKTFNVSINAGAWDVIAGPATGSGDSVALTGASGASIAIQHIPTGTIFEPFVSVSAPSANLWIDGDANPAQHQTPVLMKSPMAGSGFKWGGHKFAGGNKGLILDKSAYLSFSSVGPGNAPGSYAYTIFSEEGGIYPTKAVGDLQTINLTRLASSTTTNTVRFLIRDYAGAWFLSNTAYAIQATTTVAVSESDGWLRVGDGATSPTESYMNRLANETKVAMSTTGLGDPDWSCITGGGLYIEFASASGLFDIGDLTWTGSAARCSVPSSVEFGQTGDNMAVTTDVMIANVGGATLHTTATLDWGDTGMFTILSSPSSVGGGASAPMTVRFLPTAPGAFLANLRLECDDATGAYDILLTGDAISSIPICLTTNPVEFGQVDIGSSATRTLTVENRGLADLEVTSMTFLSGDDAVFDILTPFPLATIAYGTSRTVQLVFTPAADVLSTATYRLECAAPAVSPLVSLRGLTPNTQVPAALAVEAWMRY